MHDPFRSDYSSGASTGLTETSASGTAVPQTTLAPVERATTTTVDPTSSATPEAQRYGLGKPRRVVIRGRIARE